MATALTSTAVTASSRGDKTKPKQFLVIWDFDHSMINENSDFYVSQKVLTKRRFDELYSLKGRKPIPGDRRDFTQLSFCEFQDSVTFRYLFNEHGISRSEFRRQLSTVPWFDDNLTIVKTLGKATQLASKRLSSDSPLDPDSPLVRQVIVSNANTKLTSTILEAYQLDESMFAKIDTNQGFWQCSKDYESDPIRLSSDFGPDSKTLLTDANRDSADSMVSLMKPLQKDSEMKDCCRGEEADGDDGSCQYRLRVRSWNAQRGLDVVCPMLKNKDMCKGYIVEKEVLPYLNLEDRKANNLSLIYVGDGSNDLCPILRFSEDDFAFIRRGMALDRLTADDDPSSHLSKIKATVMKWTDGKDLLRNFSNVISHLDFSATDHASKL